MSQQDRIIDIHCHVLGNGKDPHNIDNEVFYKPFRKHHLFIRFLSLVLEEELRKLGANLEDHSISSKSYLNLMLNLLLGSEKLDAIVLLAQDATYYERGDELFNLDRTDLVVSNRFLWNKVQELNERLENEHHTHKRFLLGASVSPDNPAWEKELRYVAEKTEAVLVKIIPSAMHVKIDDPKHREYYTALKEYNLPLLCHVGPELAFSEALRNMRLDYDDYRRLEFPLSCGTTVIGAHCAAPIAPIVGRNNLKGFRRLMKRWNKRKVQLWGDTSALSMDTRIFFLPEIVKKFDMDWLVHGSDFPIPIKSDAHKPLFTYNMTFDEYSDVSQTNNPLDVDIKLKLAHKFHPKTLTNANRVLRLPKSS